MKLIFSCILAIFAFGVNGVPTSTSVPTEDFGEAMRNYFEKVKRAMPCGIAGQAPMTPFIQDFVPIAIHNDDLE